MQVQKIQNNGYKPMFKADIEIEGSTVWKEALQSEKGSVYTDTLLENLRNMKTQSTLKIESGYTYPIGLIKIRPCDKQKIYTIKNTNTDKQVILYIKDKFDSGKLKRVIYDERHKFLTDNLAEGLYKGIMMNLKELFGDTSLILGKEFIKPKL